MRISVPVLLSAIAMFGAWSCGNPPPPAETTSASPEASKPAEEPDPIGLPGAASGQADVAEPSGKPPVPIGSPAPDFTVTDMNGHPVKLSSFHGRPVLIDFWATWCVPCREGLKETERLSSAKGLQVMAVSDDENAVIKDFMKQNHYKMPAFHDEGEKAQAAYNVEAIPVTAIVDSNGRLQSYMLGLHDPKEVEAALAKVGVKLS